MIRGDALHLSATVRDFLSLWFTRVIHSHTDSFERCICGNQINYRQRRRRWFVHTTASYKSTSSHIREGIFFTRTMATARDANSEVRQIFASYVHAISTTENPACLSSIIDCSVNPFIISKQKIPSNARASSDLLIQYF